MSTLYVSDLDGTLLHSGGRLTEGSRAGLLQVLERPLHFTVASARGVCSMQTVLGDLPLRLPVIGVNGGMVSDLATATHSQVHTVLPTQARSAWEEATQRGIPVMVSTHTPEGDRVYVPTPHHEGLGAYAAERQGAGDPRLRLVPDSAVGLDEPVTSLTIIDQAPAVRGLVEALGRSGLELQTHGDFYNPGWVWLTLHPPAATKGRAVSALRDELGAGRLVVFGDERNDLSMFAAADYAVATANAVPEVQDAADEVIGHHDEDAVVQWLLHHTGG